MPSSRSVIALALTATGLVGFSLAARSVHATNPMTAALGLLVIVLAAATVSRPWIAVVYSVIAMLCLNYFFVPPVGTFSVADAHNWVSLAAFVIVGVVASRLSTAARARAQEAEARRNELGRLFDLSRDVLLTEEGVSSHALLAGHIARRFELRRTALFLPGRGGGWSSYHGTEQLIDLQSAELDRALARAGAALEFDASRRTYGGQTILTTGSGDIRLVTLRHGTRAVGLLATPADLDAGAADAIAGLAAIAIERDQLLADRKDAEIVRHRADLTSTLLASMSHDLRTPLTAIGVAIDNLDDDAIPPAQRREQVNLAQSELQRLNRLFRDILDMARIDVSALSLAREWVTPADIVDAALANLRPGLADRQLSVDADDARSVLVDPRLTSAALSQLVENAARYSPVNRPIVVRGWVDEEGLRFAVRDHGPGLDADELDHLFERFYRGRAGRQAAAGSGMGLAITRGLLAAEGGRVWGENVSDGGALFSIAVPGITRLVGAES